MKLPTLNPTPPTPPTYSDQPGQKLAFELLLTCIDSRAKYIMYSRMDPVEKIEMLADIREFTEQINLGNITTEVGLRKLRDYISQEGKSISREDFIYKTTQYLRIQLGEKRWNHLVDSVANGLQVASTQLVAHGGLSILNRELNSPNISVFKSEHWLVTMVLLALEPTYNELLLGYEAMISEQLKGSGVTFTSKIGKVRP